MAYIPDSLLDAIRMQESGNLPPGRQVSDAGAMGPYQFMPGTGVQYGLRSTADFFDPVKSREAARSYLSDLTDQFGGDTDKAIAAYNAGPGRVRSSLTTGAPLPGETQAYVPKVKAYQTAFEQGQPPASYWTATASAAPTSVPIYQAKAGIQSVAPQPGGGAQGAKPSSQPTLPGTDLPINYDYAGRPIPPPSAPVQTPTGPAVLPPEQQRPAAAPAPVSAPATPDQQPAQAVAAQAPEQAQPTSRYGPLGPKGGAAQRPSEMDMVKDIYNTPNPFQKSIENIQSQMDDLVKKQSTPQPLMSAEEAQARQEHYGRMDTFGIAAMLSGDPSMQAVGQSLHQRAVENLEDKYTDQGILDRSTGTFRYFPAYQQQQQWQLNQQLMARLQEQAAVFEQNRMTQAHQLGVRMDANETRLLNSYRDSLTDYGNTTKNPAAAVDAFNELASLPKDQDTPRSAVAQTYWKMINPDQPYDPAKGMELLENSSWFKQLATRWGVVNTFSPAARDDLLNTLQYAVAPHAATLAGAIQRARELEPQYRNMPIVSQPHVDSLLQFEKNTPALTPRQQTQTQQTTQPAAAPAAAPAPGPIKFKRSQAQDTMTGQVAMPQTLAALNAPVSATTPLRLSRAVAAGQVNPITGNPYFQVG